MKDTRKLFETFGELVYVVAMSDGKIHPEEREIIEKKLANHPWGSEIKWSFDYEVSKGNSIEELYKKVISYCEIHGPDEEYDFLIELLKDVAKADGNKNGNERVIIEGFTNDLIQKFKQDLQNLEDAEDVD